MYKIAIDGRELKGKSGVSTYLGNLVKNYNEPDMEFCFASLENTLPFKSNAAWSNISLPFYLAKEKIDLYHSPFFTLPLLKTCKMILTVHDVIFEVNPAWFPVKNLLSFKLFTRTALRTADKIITDSQASKNDLVRFFSCPAEKIVVIPLAPAEIFRPVREVKKIFEKYILYVGNLGNRKNIVRLVRAFEKLNLGHQLVLVGGQGYKGEDVLRMIAGSPQITYLAKVGDDELVQLYNGAALFVYPSLYEGFGLPILEAMACGTPVATSNVSSLLEVAGDAALLFNPEDIDDITDKMRRLLTNSELRASLRQRGLARAAEFSWKKAARQTIQVYREVLGQ